MERTTNNLNELAKIELARRELAKRKLIRFTKYVFPGYQIKPHNQLIADALDLAIEGRIRRLMVFVPPQYGKSELVSRKLPAYTLGKYPDRKIILTSYNAGLAITFSREARDLIMTELYQNIFGANSTIEDENIVELSESSRSVQNWHLAGHRGGVLAQGVGGGITGHGADLAIVDDPVKDDVEAQSERQRDTLWDWWWSVLYTRLSPASSIILCMTRWNEDDLAGRLLNHQDEVRDYWHVLRLSAIAETPQQVRNWCEKNLITPDRLLTRQRVNELSA